MNANTFFDDDGSDVTVAQVAPLTDRVNSEPPILKGLSATETMVAMAVLFPLWFVVGGLLALLFKRWQILPLLAVIGPMVSVWMGAGFFASFKRNRPDHYYWHAFVWKRHHLGFGVAPFIAHRGAWDLGRSMPVIAPASLTWGQRVARALGA